MRLLWLLLLFALHAQAAGLGLLTAHGSARLNGFRVWDNGTVFDNMDVETERVPARITFDSGAEILLAPATRIHIGNGTVTLANGSLLLRHPGTLVVKAADVKRDTSGALMAGPRASIIPRLLNELFEKKPLSQGP